MAVTIRSVTKPGTPAPNLNLLFHSTILCSTSNSASPFRPHITISYPTPGTMLPIALVPFFLHEIVSLIAGFTFVLRPHKQLAPLSPSAKLILRCYGGCLIFTTLISHLFLTRPKADELTRRVALIFAFWHAWPSYRAIIRIRYDIDMAGELGETLGGPWAHLAVHVALMVLFLNTGLTEQWLSS